MKIEIKKNNRIGHNGYCRTCGKLQDGWKAQPFIVWYIADGKKRGHNVPVCSIECAEKLVEILKGE